MFNTLKTAVLSAMIGLGTLSAMPATAQADGLYLNLGGRHDSARAGVYLGDADRIHYRRDRYHRHHRVCTPGRALDKAERIGLRHARVVDVDRRTIEVRGHKRGHRVNVTFGRSPSCPIVGW